MILQTETIKSESEKCFNYEFYHPTTLRRCFAWIPKSQIKELNFNQIKIPDWLWYSIKQKL